jgi:1,4-dihydroxy-2-naphthoate octaprenyltransferase
MARATLGFCDIKFTRHSRFGPVNTSSSDARASWLATATSLGRSLSRGPFSAGQRFWQQLSPWLSALRLQFYPMTFCAYWMGALLATQSSAFDLPRFWLGYLLLFCLEAATVFANDIEDQETDRENRFWGPFNGGSRVLQDKLLSPARLKRGMSAMLVLTLTIAVVVTMSGSPPVLLGSFLAVSAVLTLGYTLPPLRLSYRTLGELDVGLTHSFLAVVFGYMLQGGSVSDMSPWFLATPLFFSILPAITLSGVPDRDADQAAGKRTIAVVFGIHQAFSLAAIAAVAAAVTMIVIDRVILPGTFGTVISLLASAHAGLILRRLYTEIQQPPRARRIDRTMVIALSYILWFCIPPLWGNAI